MSDSERRDRFLEAVQILHHELDEITRAFDMKGQAVNIMLTGVVDYDAFGEPVLKAVFTLDVDSESVLLEAFDFLHFSYENSFSHENEYRDDQEEYESQNWWRDLFDDLDSPEKLN